MESALLHLFLWFYVGPAAISFACFCVLIVCERAFTWGDALDAALWTFIPFMNILTCVVGPRFAWTALCESVDWQVTQTRSCFRSSRR